MRWLWPDGYVYDVPPPRVQKRNGFLMNKDRHQAAVAAMTELIRGELDSDDRARFARVQRLCRAAHKLLLEGDVRAKDFRGPGPQNGMGAIFPGAAWDGIDGEIQDPPDLGEAYPQAGMGQFMQMPGVPLDQAGLVRQMLQMMGPLNLQNEARAKESEAHELNELLMARRMLEGSNEPAEKDTAARLTARIDALTARIGKEQPHAAADLVLAEPLRRHPPGFEAGGQDPRDDGGPVAAGADCPRGPLQEGDEGARAVRACVDIPG